jgi:hypothetical protein
MDPVQRQVEDMMGALRARTPTLSDKEPPKVDLFGDPLPYDVAYWDGINLPIPNTLKRAIGGALPVQPHEANDDVVFQELWNQDAQLARPKPYIDKVRLTPAQYAELMQLIGHGIKVTDINGNETDLKGAMRALIGSEVYRDQQDGPDGGKAKLLRTMYVETAQIARQLFLLTPEQMGDPGLARDLLNDGFELPNHPDLTMRIARRRGEIAALSVPSYERANAVEQVNQQIKELEGFFRNRGATP